MSVWLSPSALTTYISSSCRAKSTFAFRECQRGRECIRPKNNAFRPIKDGLQRLGEVNGKAGFIALPRESLMAAEMHAPITLGRDF